ncbi:hypothetical protein ACXM2N_02130 [Corynebacterium sp. ZY180755]
MTVPFPLLAPLMGSSGAAGAGVAGSAGLGNIAAATGLLAAAGGGLRILADAVKSPEKLVQKLMTTAMVDVIPVAQQSTKILTGARQLRENNPAIEFLKDLVMDIAGGAVGNTLFFWITDLINNEESDKKVEKDTCNCGESVHKVNDNCGSQVDAIGQTTITAVTAMLQALSAINPAVNPAAYKQGLDVISNYINKASELADECITDRDNTMGELIEALISVVEAQANKPLNEQQPDPHTSDTCAPGANEGSVPAGNQASSAGGANTPVEQGEGCENTSKPAPPEAPSAPRPQDGAAGGGLSSSGAVGSVGKQWGAQLGAAVTGFFEQLIGPSSTSTTAHASSCLTMASSAPGIVGGATLAGAAAIVGVVGDEISKFVHHAASNIHATIESFREQALPSCEPAPAPVDAECEPKPVEAECEPKPVADTVEHPEDCERPDEKQPEDTPKPAPSITENGFDKSSLKPAADTQPASAAGFDKSGLTGSPAAPAAPTVQVSPPQPGSSAASSASAGSTIHSVGEW